MANNNSGNKQWAIAVPALSDVNAMDPTRTRLPTGVYPVKILETVQYPPREPGQAGSLYFACEVIDGEHKGRQSGVYIGLDFAKKGNLSAIKTTLLSIGAQEHQIAGGIPNLGPNTFANRTAFLYVETAPEGEKDAKDNRNFITPELYAQLKAKFAAQPAAGAAVGGPAPTLGAPVGMPSAIPTAAPVGAAPLANGVAGGVAALGSAIGSPAAAQPAPVGGVTF